MEEYIVLLICDGKISDSNQRTLASLGFRKTVATDDKRVVLQIPNPGYTSIRTGDSPEEVRDEVFSELGRSNISAFIVVAQNFACGRT